MAYHSHKVSDLINLLNVKYFLPAIQREFVWRPEQIVGLFDSIMRGYPIGSFLFWEMKPENYDKVDIYKFVEHYKASETHSESAYSHGVPQLTLVLDGQQRLTSLLIGLKGTYTIRKKWRRRGSSDPSAFSRQRLYLDLLNDPRIAEEDGEGAIYYGFQFLETKPENDQEHYWIEVGRILDFDSEDRFDEFRLTERENLPGSTSLEQAKIFDRVLQRLYRAIWRDEVIAEYTEHDQDSDRVLDIFVRANSGGTQLSKSDLLLSMITSKWADTNAREEIFGFVDHVNTEMERYNSLDKDFVMKACLVLSDLPVAYKVENFNHSNLSLIQSKWENIKRAIQDTVRLVNSFGIDRDTLTSANALIPIAYYLFKHPGAVVIGGSEASNAANARAIRSWLAMSLINRVFAASSDTLLAEIRRVQQANEDKKYFPAAEISEQIAKAGRVSTFDDSAINNFLSVEYGRPNTFLALSLLYSEHSWGSCNLHQDHIFPRSLFTRHKMTEIGIDYETQDRYLALVNNIANLELLVDRENEEKLDKRFEDWLPSRDSDFRRRHLIPDDDTLFQFHRFEDFIYARQDLIEQRLRALFGPINANQTAVL